jgi:hypothetical protein
MRELLNERRKRATERRRTGAAQRDRVIEHAAQRRSGAPRGARWRYPSRVPSAEWASQASLSASACRTVRVASAMLQPHRAASLLRTASPSHGCRAARRVAFAHGMRPAAPIAPRSHRAQGLAFAPASILRTLPAPCLSPSTQGLGGCGAVMRRLAAAPQIWGKDPPMVTATRVRCPNATQRESDAATQCEPDAVARRRNTARHAESARHHACLRTARAIDGSESQGATQCFAELARPARWTPAVTVARRVTFTHGEQPCLRLVRRRALGPPLRSDVARGWGRRSSAVAS